MKSRMIGLAACALMTCLMIPTDAASQAAGRVAGTVVDVEGKPIAGVRVTITTPSLVNYEESATSNKKGRFLVAHSDSTFTYTYKLEKEGFEVLIEKVRATAGGATQRTFVLRPAGAGGGTPGTAATLSGQAAAVFNTGVEAQNAGDLDTAAERYARAAELDPTLSAPHTGLAGVYYLQQDYAGAAAEAEKALELDPSDARALQIRYDAYRRSGDPRAAEAADALKTSGGDAAAAGRVYNEAIDAYRAGDRATARELLAQAVAVDPALVQPHVFLAAMCNEDGDLECAAREIDAAFELEPDNLLATRLAHQMAVAAGDVEAEMELSARLARIDPEYAGDQLFTRGVGYYDTNRFAEAVILMNLVLEIRPDEPRALFIRGMAAFNSGDGGAARRDLQRFVELAPDDPDAAIARDLLSYVQ